MTVRGPSAVRVVSQFAYPSTSAPFVLSVAEGAVEVRTGLTLRTNGKLRHYRRVRRDRTPGVR